MNKLFLLIMLAVFSVLIFGCTPQVDDLNDLVDVVDDGTPPPSGGGSGSLSTMKSPELIVAGENTTCWDSDGGDEPFVKGYTLLYFPDGSASARYDSCNYGMNGPTNNLTEFFCNGTERVFAEHYCEFGCYDGECLSEELVMPEEIASYFNAFKQVNIETQEVLYLSADLSTSVFELNNDADFSLGLFCYADGKQIGSDSASYPEEASFSSANDYVFHSLRIQALNEQQLSDMQCYRHFQYGPYYEFENILSGGIVFPTLHSLKIVQELGSNEYNLNFIGSSPAGIEQVRIHLDVEYPNNQFESFSFYRYYENPVTNFNELIPINITGEEVEISIYGEAGSSDPYIYTAGWKSYIFSETIPEVIVEQTKQSIISSSADKIVVESASGSGKTFSASSKQLTEDEIIDMHKENVRKDILRSLNE